MKKEVIIDNLQFWVDLPIDWLHEFLLSKGWEFFNPMNDYKHAYVKKDENVSILAKAYPVEESNDLFEGEMVIDDIWSIDGIYDEPKSNPVFSWEELKKIVDDSFQQAENQKPLP